MAQLVRELRRARFKSWLDLNAFVRQNLWCIEAKLRKVKISAVAGNINPGHLACAASALPDNLTTTTICTEQVVLKCLSQAPSSKARVLSS